MYMHNINPILVKLGFIEIRYYGLIYVIGFLLAYFLINYLAKKKELPLTTDDVGNLIIYLLIGIIVGARLFHVFILHPGDYHTFIEVIDVTKGGMAFHGGLIGAIIAGYLFTKKKKINFWDLADIVVIPLALALFLGRIGNFINGELYGRVTNLPWAVIFPNADNQPRHPSQLYEAGKNLVIFFTLWWLKDKKMPRGYLFLTFLIMYGALRTTIEFFRQPDNFGIIILGLTAGQILSLSMLGIGIFFMIWLKYRSK